MQISAVVFCINAYIKLRDLFHLLVSPFFSLSHTLCHTVIFSQSLTFNIAFIILMVVQDITLCFCNLSMKDIFLFSVISTFISPTCYLIDLSFALVCKITIPRYLQVYIFTHLQIWPSFPTYINLFHCSIDLKLSKYFRIYYIHIYTFLIVLIISLKSQKKKKFIPLIAATLWCTNRLKSIAVCAKNLGFHTWNGNIRRQSKE